MKSRILTLKSPTRDLSRQNFSTHCQYDIKQTSNEKKEKYQSGDF